MDIKKKKRYIDSRRLLRKEKGNEIPRRQARVRAVLREAMKRDPKNPAYPNNLAALTKLKPCCCQTSLRKALSWMKSTKAIAKKGDLEMLMKEYHKAIETYKKGLTIEPGTPASSLQRVHGHLQRGRRQRRAEQAMKDPRSRPSSRTPWCAVIYVCRRNGRPANAR